MKKRNIFASLLLSMGLVLAAGTALISRQDKAMQAKADAELNDSFDKIYNDNFNNVAGVKFGIKSLSSTYVARYTIKKMFKNKLIIIPGFMNRLSQFGLRFVSRKTAARIAYNVQKRKDR